MLLMPARYPPVLHSLGWGLNFPLYFLFQYRAFLLITQSQPTIHPVAFLPDQASIIMPNNWPFDLWCRHRFYYCESYVTWGLCGCSYNLFIMFFLRYRVWFEVFVLSWQQNGGNALLFLQIRNGTYFAMWYI